MASSTASTKIACLILVTMLVIAPHHSAQAAIECPAVLKMVSPCLDYLKQGGDIPTECCAGVKSLDSITKTQPARQEACQCIKPAADSNGINYDLANKLAPACGVDIQINITPNMDCSTVPVTGKKELNLHLLYVEVTKRGGYDKVVFEKKWREISSNFNFSSTTTSASFVLKKHYLSLLYQFEQVYFFNLQGPVIQTPSPVSSIPLSIPAIGTIDGKFDCGYLVTVKVGHDVLSGVIYHPAADDPPCTPSSPAEDLSMAIIPYDPTQPRKASRRRRRKRKRWGGDPTHPKPNRSGYNFFFSEKHSMLKSLYPNSREREFTKMIGELWNNLGPQERVVYQNIGLRDKERYRRELQEYNEKLAANQLGVGLSNMGSVANLVERK